MKQLTLALIGLVALAGCGGGESEEDQARGVVEDFTQAVADKKGDAACDLLNFDGKEAIAPGRDCVVAVKGLGSDEPVGAGEFFLGETDFPVDPDILKFGKVTDARVNGDEARVTLEYKGDEYETGLVKDDEGWRISKPPGF